MNLSGYTFSFKSLFEKERYIQLVKSMTNSKKFMDDTSTLKEYIILTNLGMQYALGIVLFCHLKSEQILCTSVQV